MLKSTEEWKDIKEFEGIYQVSNLGRVRSLDRKVWNGLVFYTRPGRILKGGLTGYGYMRITLRKNGKVVYKLIHQLVAKAFIPNPNNLRTVNHKDEIKTNNKVVNLEWMTRGDNIRYSRSKECELHDPSTGVSYWAPSQAAMSRMLGIPSGNLNQVLHGKQESAGGYTRVIY